MKCFNIIYILVSLANLPKGFACVHFFLNSFNDFLETNYLPYQNRSTSTGLIFTIFFDQIMVFCRLLIWTSFSDAPREKNGKVTSIQQAGVQKMDRNMAVSMQKYSVAILYSYIPCKFDQDWSSNPRDYRSNNCTFLDETAKISISH